MWINNCLIVLFAEREDKRWGGYQRTRSLNTGKFDLQGEKKAIDIKGTSIGVHFTIN